MPAQALTVLVLALGCLLILTLLGLWLFAGTISGPFRSAVLIAALVVTGTLGCAAIRHGGPS